MYVCMDGWGWGGHLNHFINRETKEHLFNHLGYRDLLLLSEVIIKDDNRVNYTHHDSVTK